MVDFLQVAIPEGWKVSYQIDGFSMQEDMWVPGAVVPRSKEED